MAANQDLLDADFLRVLEVVAEVKSEAGQENIANWLRGLATYLNTPATPLPMNEQRQQAYLNLIRNLLDAPSGEAPKILAAHQDLLDAGLVKKMLEIASNLLSQSELDQANRLMNIVEQQLGVYGELSLTATEKEYFNFLYPTLQATKQSKGKIPR